MSLQPGEIATMACAVIAQTEKLELAPTAWAAALRIAASSIEEAANAQFMAEARANMAHNLRKKS